nr:uncharacterized protein LOC112805491 [Arachis hypogaea]
MWRQVISRFGISEVVILDNWAQFADEKFGKFLAGLGVRQKFSSVEHPQTNGQVEAANKVILQGLRKWLDQKKGAWADELASVLWSYKTTPQSSTRETPFRLTYGLNAVIPMEVGGRAHGYSLVESRKLWRRIWSMRPARWLTCQRWR